MLDVHRKKVKCSFMDVNKIKKQHFTFKTYFLHQ